MLKAAARSHKYRQNALLLETGLRTAELIGLTWIAVDWNKQLWQSTKALNIDMTGAIGVLAHRKQSHVTDESLVNAVHQFETVTPTVEKRCKKGVIKI